MYIIFMNAYVHRLYLSKLVIDKIVMQCYDETIQRHVEIKWDCNENAKSDKISSDSTIDIGKL